MHDGLDETVLADTEKMELVKITSKVNGTVLWTTTYTRTEQVKGYNNLNLNYMKSNQIKCIGMDVQNRLHLMPKEINVKCNSHTSLT